jgi:type IV pilus assembly protein PilW
MKYRTFFSFIQQGLTLVEVLLAIAIGSLLLIGLTEIFVSNKATYNMQEGLSRLQENARFALQVMSKDFRMANFLGCAQKNYNANNALVSAAYRNVLKDDPSNLMWTFDAGIQGFEAAGGGFIPDRLDEILAGPPPDEGSDIISLKIARGNGYSLKKDMTDSGDDDDKYDDNESLEVLTNNTTSLKAGYIAIITDCTTTTLFQVTSFSSESSGEATVDHVIEVGAPGNESDRLGYPFLQGARVIPVETTSYFVRDGFLWRQTRKNGSISPDSIDSDKLIDGVDSMQVTYGLDSARNDERADVYHTADTIDGLGAWRNVVSVRIGLLLRTADEVTPGKDTKVYQVNGQDIDPVDDRRLRRIFSNTIALRNRTP